MLFREWFIVFLTGCFIGVVFLSQSFSSRVPQESYISSLGAPKIEVEVLGAVQRPGLYVVEQGSTLQSIVEKAGLEKSADKRALHLRKKVLSSCVLFIPQKKTKKYKKKKCDSSSMARMFCTDENARNLSKTSENIGTRSVSRNF